MPKSPLHKCLQEYISKIKKTPSSHFRIPSKSISRSTRRFIKGCRHPKTHSFAFQNNSKDESKNNGENNEAATLEDVDRFLFENFKSLYMNDNYDDEKSKCSDPNEPPTFIKPSLNLYGPKGCSVSTRSSNSLMEDIPRTSVTISDDVGSSSTTTRSIASYVSGTGGTFTTREDSGKVTGPEDFIALFTYSPNPYNDFKQSMQEMIDARLHHHGKVDWEFMEELLSCYMDLNDKRSYKYILSAFVDLVVTLRENSNEVVRSK